MKKLIIVSIGVALAMLTGACANSESTAQQAAAAAASCGSVTPTTAVQTLATVCRVSASEERILVESLSLPSNGDAIDIVFKTNDTSIINPATGVRLTLANVGGNLSMTLTNPANTAANNCQRNLTTGSIPTKVCIELHNEGGNVHGLAAINTNCDSGLLATSANVVFNTENQGASGVATCSGTLSVGNAGTYPSGTNITYNKTNTGTVGKITTLVKNITE